VRGGGQRDCTGCDGRTGKQTQRGAALHGVTASVTD
jgi:hypothetical protein